MREHVRPPGSEPIVVLGGGIAGLAAADALASAGFRVIVVECSAQCGGTHRSHAIGSYTFDVGSIFYEPTARLFDMAPGLRELCLTVQRRQRRIAPGGTLLHYPIEPREFLRGPRVELALGIADLLGSRLTVKRNGTLAAISRKRLGERIFRSTGLRDYITRFNHVPPEQVSESFFFHRMAFIDRSTRMSALFQMAGRALFTRHSIANRPRRALYVRPREGFSALFEAIEHRLRARGVEFRMNAPLQRISREGPLLRIETDRGETLHCRTAVCAMPLDAVHRALFHNGSGLVSLDMTTLFVSARSLDPGLGNVLFNFDTRGRWKRATIYSRIYPDPAIEREYLAVECTIPPDGAHDPQAVFDDFRKHLQELRFAEDLRLEGSDLVKDCYPLYRPGTDDTLQTVLDKITGFGIIPVGRQGRFEYLPTSSGVIRRVMEELTAVGLVEPMRTQVGQPAPDAGPSTLAVHP